MDELLNILTSEDASEFMFFVDDYHMACEDVAWGYNQGRPFLQQLAYVMDINGERD